MKKAFDKVNKEIRVDRMSRRLIKELFMKLKTAIKVNERLTNWIEIVDRNEPIFLSVTNPFLNFLSSTCSLIF